MITGIAFATARRLKETKLLSLEHTFLGEIRVDCEKRRTRFGPRGTASTCWVWFGSFATWKSIVNIDECKANWTGRTDPIGIGVDSPYTECVGRSDRRVKAIGYNLQSPQGILDGLGR